MLQLTYISTATKEMDPGQMNGILAASRRNNGIAGVTGLLLYDGKRFLQALEGEPAEVRSTYARIKDDPRHRAIVLLSSNEVDKRSFGNWEMAAHRVAAGAGRDLASLVDELTAGVLDANVRETFRGFAKIRTAA